MGICINYELAKPGSLGLNPSMSFKFSLSYFSISFALKLILTSMIVIRLFLHNRKTKRTLGTSGGLYMSIVSMIIESSALYAVAMLLFFVPWAAKFRAHPEC